MIIAITLIWLTGAIILYFRIRKQVKASYPWTVSLRRLALVVAFFSSWLLLATIWIDDNNKNQKPASW